MMMIMIRILEAPTFCLCMPCLQEDGVEERNVFERNLAAYVHPIQTAGTSGGQQGTDRWQSAALFDPSDSGASGFYALNAYNTW